MAQIAVKLEEESSFGRDIDGELLLIDDRISVSRGGVVLPLEQEIKVCRANNVERD